MIGFGPQLGAARAILPAPSVIAALAGGRFDNLQFRPPGGLLR